MNKQIEALKMAIDEARIGLGKVRQYLGWQEPIEDELCLEILKAWKTLDACKEALAEADKQKPVGYIVPDYKEIMKFHHGQTLMAQEKTDLHKIPVYSRPVAWQSLSDDEIEKIQLANGGFYKSVSFARAIEQALKEKNHEQTD